MWPDEWLWNKLSGDPAGSPSKPKTYKPGETWRRVEQTYDHGTDEEWREAVNEWDEENTNLFGSAQTCADMEQNVIDYLKTQNLPIERTPNRDYRLVNREVDMEFSTLDRLIEFAKIVKDNE